MNPQIKELAEQATRKYDRLGNDIPFAQPDLELFAELIVRECCEVAHSNFHVDGLTLGGIMKKHFGVE